MLTLLLAACSSPNKVDQDCFLSYLGDARGASSTYYTCVDTAPDSDAVDTCASDLGSESTAALATLGSCAGEGCISDWVACVTASNELSCYDALQQCGGWMNTALVDDCNNDAYFCGQSAGCSEDFYDCMVYAAGG